MGKLHNDKDRQESLKIVLAGDENPEQITRDAQ